jgi:diguanylate cyclase (GGDEF)-like protein
MEAPLTYSRLERLLLGSLASAPASVRGRMLATIPPPPLSLALTYLTLIFIAVTAAVYLGKPWAWGWAAFTTAIVALRAVHPLLTHRTHPEHRLFQIILGTAVLFVGFGLGAAACVASGNPAVALVSLTGVLGIVAGLSSRWASVPRAAIATMTLTSIPPVIALTSHGGPEAVAGIVLVLLVLSIVAYTLQNHHYLLTAAHAEDDLRHLARTDALTGLVNRIELERLLAQACVSLHGGGPGQRLSVLYMDLDGFKAINDEHGHAAGDAVLKQVAQVLRATLPSSATIARMGGDEFIVLLPGTDEVSARRIADHLISNLSQPHTLPGGHVVRIGSSVGISLAPTQGTDPEVLLARADQALYASKHRGKGQTGIWRTLK